ncbi:SPOR domain-containing protein [Zooshikella marina]|uniref:SPOR domain-containing protein n=1 Tax=Zooshikella ganghwensis TaxID=202772 RepID=UPI001BAFF1DF|nr:SPOR domain-containing protein [Zooshikella ganghwensis]MBU2705269.1 SPOR domain-containing protein [Zooshikella ganghwensis]
MLIDDGLKQRVVGAIVLVAIAAIFLPWLFDEKTTYERVSAELPPPPPVIAEPDFVDEARAQAKKELAAINPNPEQAEVVIDEPVLDETTASTAALDTTSVSEKTDAVSSEPNQDTQQVVEPSVAEQPAAKVVQQDNAEDKPSLDAKGLPISWTIQVGTFADSNNANSLVKKLQTEGYKAYSQKLPSNKHGVITRVFVGPRFTKKQLQPVVQALHEKWQLDGIIVRYTP